MGINHSVDKHFHRILQARSQADLLRNCEE